MSTGNIKQLLSKEYAAEVEKNRLRVKSIMKCILLLASCESPLRGDVEKGKTKLYFRLIWYKK